MYFVCTYSERLKEHITYLMTRTNNLNGELRRGKPIRVTNYCNNHIICSIDYNHKDNQAVLDKLVREISSLHDFDTGAVKGMNI